MRRKTDTLIHVSDHELTAFATFGILLSIVFSMDALGVLEEANMSFFDNPWISLGINVFSSIGVTIALTVTVYFQFLRHIPEENERRINQLLNDRLSHETTNHNAEMAALNPNTAQLSKEHDLIRNDVELIKVEFIRQSSRADAGYDLMKDSQREVVNVIRRLDAIPRLWEELLTENQQLKTENKNLQAQLTRQDPDREGTRIVNHAEKYQPEKAGIFSWRDYTSASWD